MSDGRTPVEEVLRDALACVTELCSWSSVPQKLIYRMAMRSLYADKENGGRRIRSSGLDWTVVYPTGLNDAPKGTFRVDDRLPMKAVPYVSRADVAAFLRRAVHSDEWIPRSPVISG